MNGNLECYHITLGKGEKAGIVNVGNVSMLYFLRDNGRIEVLVGGVYAQDYSESINEGLCATFYLSPVNLENWKNVLSKLEEAYREVTSNNYGGGELDIKMIDSTGVYRVMPKEGGVGVFVIPITAHTIYHIYRDSNKENNEKLLRSVGEELMRESAYEL